MPQERWPPIYDATDLQETIRSLSSAKDGATVMYETSLRDFSCQGDILSLASELPLIWEDGKPATQGDFKDWLIIGNTCDLDRNLEEVPFTQIVPIVSVDLNSITPQLRQQFCTYAYSRRFFLPPWGTKTAESIHFADFLRPVTIHRSALDTACSTQATLTRKGWILLHSCLVRYLARDDGRCA